MKKLSIILFAIIFAALLLTACGSSDKKADTLLSTPIGDFTYTQTYTDTFGDMTATGGSTFLVIALTPSSTIDTTQDFSISDIKLILGEDSYEAMLMQERYNADDQLTQINLVYVVEESRAEEDAELVLP